MLQYYYIIVWLSILCVGCSPHPPEKTICYVENSNSLDYVINKQLTLEAYSKINGYSPAEGLISTAALAFQIAEPILISVYGDDVVEKEKPFSINLEDNIWMIEGKRDKDDDGGVAYMEINRCNGAVLKIIHTK